MLRRRAAIHPRAAIIALGGPTRNFFDNLKKQLGAVTSSSNDGSTSSNNNNSNASSSNSSSKAGDANTPSGFPPGFNAQQMQTLQQLFNSQPKEKQEQLLKQAMDMQRMLSKVPGMGKLAQKNMAMMEQMLKMQSGAAPSSGGSNTSASQSTASPNARRDLFHDAAMGSASSKSRSGPSLDELKKVNLGPEIEALFEELRSIRSRKNEYRGKYHTAQTALDGLREEHRDLVAREANVRSKLAKAEQEVMLLTSENMELRDSSKAVKQLSQTNKQLKQEVEQLKSAAQASAAPGTASYAALKQQYQASEDALRSLQRKVDRMRRRDPLLQFSLACSDVSRHCVAIRADESNAAAAAAAGSPTSATGAAYSGGESVISEAGQEAAEQAFANLQSSYMQRQQEAWRTAAHEHGAAAKAYVAVVRRYVTTRVPHANYDAVVSFTGDLSALRAAFTSVGFNVEAIPGETNKVHVVVGADAGPLTEQPGPYGYAFALRLATASQARQASTNDHGSGTKLGAAGFTVTTACPYVSSALVDNAKRSVVQYETARASGPGGQATNVTETQVYAKLSIDGVPAFTAEAQDSRSALSNKEAALDKLRQQRRHQYNETLAKQEKAEVVQAQLTAAMCRQGGLTVEAEVMQLVQEAAAANDVSAEDAALVAMLQELSRIAAMTT